MPFPIILIGTVTLLTLLMAGEFGAILWLLQRRCDHKRAGKNMARKAGNSPKAAFQGREPAVRLRLAIFNLEMPKASPTTRLSPSACCGRCCSNHRPTLG